VPFRCDDTAPAGGHTGNIGIGDTVEPI
jgi:hypothetical protein